MEEVAFGVEVHKGCWGRRPGELSKTEMASRQGCEDLARMR